MKIIYTSKNEKILVDDKDYEYLNQWKWNTGLWGYPFRMAENGTKDGKRCRKIIKMHRVVINAQKGQEVDHIDGNKLDNRKQNLRFVTKQQNIRNRGVTKRNKYGYKGVTRTTDKRYKSPWKMTTHDPIGQQIVLYFKTAEDALKKYDEYNELWFGEYAMTNKRLGLI